jgi:hypothetical protein
LHLQFGTANNCDTSFPWDIGRRDGGDGGDQGRKASTRNPSGRDRTVPRGNPPLNLAQLRALRAEAAEARRPKGSGSTAPPTASLTPLSAILMLARKVSMHFTAPFKFQTAIPLSRDMYVVLYWLFEKYRGC